MIKNLKSNERRENKNKIGLANKNHKMSDEQKLLVSKRFKNSTPWNKGIKKKIMLKSSELRIGNLVYDINGKVIEIEEVLRYIISFSFKLGIGHSSYKSIKPIPLTEEWLLKFGFNKKYDFLGIPFFNFKDFELDGIFYEYCLSNGDCLKIKYIHQLQNLYFTLTGEELTTHSENETL